MLSVELVVREFAEKLIEGIQNNIRDKRVTNYGAMEASGESADSFFWSYDGKRLQIGSKFEWITVLEDGRPPGKRPPAEPIKRWVFNKPIDDFDIPLNSLVFLIQRSIGEKGSLLYQQGGNSGILSDYLNEEYIRTNLFDKLEEMVEDITINILTTGRR